MVRDRSSDVSAACRKLMKVDTPGDKLIGVWIWEYVLKHTSDVSLIRELTESLAFPKDVPRLKQMILLKELSFQVSKDLDTKKTLDTLEAFRHAFEKESLDKAAESEDMVLLSRFKASSVEAPKVRDDAGAQSVWQGVRQPTLELKGKLQKLLTLAAGENAGAQNAMIKDIENELSALIKNAWAIFGLTFLEKTEAAVNSGKYKPQGVSLPLSLASQQNMARTMSENGVNTRNEDLPESARRVLDECRVELQKDVSGRNKDLKRAQQALADSCVELQKLVKDPLPALIRRPDSISEAAGIISTGKMKRTAEPAITRDLLEPHPSAQAHGWDEDDEEFPDPDSPSASRRIRLPLIHSPERTPVNPLKPTIGEFSFVTRSATKHRRQKKKWSEEEVETLKREVRKYGKGRWKMILQKNSDVFHERTEVDIKDKWRNLEKYNLI